MRPNIPILTITLHIPLTPDTEVDEVLEAISSTVTEALGEIRRQEAEDLPEQESDEVGIARRSEEALESHTETTSDDQLVKLVGFTRSSANVPTAERPHASDQLMMPFEHGFGFDQPQAIAQLTCSSSADRFQFDGEHCQRQLLAFRQLGSVALVAFQNR